MKKYSFLLSLFILLIACKKHSTTIALIPKNKFETKIGTKQVSLYNLKNQKGMTCQITNFGARVVSLWVKDKNDIFTDIVLGYDSIEDYQKPGANYIGATIGRYANRIAAGKFTLNDSTYILAKNNGENHAHGGVKGFNNVVWDANQLSESELQLTYFSPDGEEGYPGNLTVSLLYSLSEANELKISYTATCDQETPINLTHHSFFNLNGAGAGEITDHLLSMPATKYIPITEDALPTGEILPVLNTPFDFTATKTIGKHIGANSEQLVFGHGYDHCFVLEATGVKLAAKLEAPSGICMEVYTSEPGIQLYTGNFLNGAIHIGKGAKHYERRTALCLEAQHYPNSPNQANFPSTILKPGTTYQSTTNYKFGNK
ncbi:hypothetical protein BZG02_05810 [Labilibaculum filiforme]|uniref:Aldose 1-epimerase n=1 Tax=Labilibaculum filiforme TaxID=1940526 RepID=A0A2N3I1Z8_9BACT|nr:aldose epimerase family protein [Labilibaculum filiforme]PKQ64331.1 hypothetical protein BZG02_05810 [Labilibaculum filiforme]